MEKGEARGMENEGIGTSKHFGSLDLLTPCKR